MSHTRGRVRAVAALALGVAVSVPVALSGPAAAGTPDSWTVVDDIGIAATNRVGMQRGPAGLQLVWTRTELYPATAMTRTVTATGVAGATSAMIPGSQAWDTLAADPVPLAGGIALSGLRGMPGDRSFWSGRGFLAAPGGGITATLSSAEDAFAGELDATMSGTSPVFVFSQSDSVNLHVGSSVGTDATVTSGGGCCAHQPAVELTTPDRGWVAWYSEKESPASRGWLARPVSGLPAAPVFGSVRPAPGALTGGGAVEADQRAALARRPDGSIWLAYPVGYPAAKKIRVWRVGTGVYRDLTVGQSVRHVGLSADAAGRLWVSYALPRTRQVAVARTNVGVTRFGSPDIARAPSEVFATTIDATPGRADVVVTTGTALHHRQFLPILTATGRVTRVIRTRAGQGGAPDRGKVDVARKQRVKVRVAVREAGSAVIGARVRIAGHGRQKTGPTGVARFVFPRTGNRAEVTVTRPDYRPTRFRLSLRK